MRDACPNRSVRSDLRRLSGPRCAWVLLFFIGATCFDESLLRSAPHSRQDSGSVRRSVESEKRILTIYSSSPSPGARSTLNEMSRWIPITTLAAANVGECVVEREGLDPLKGEELSRVIFSSDLTHYAFVFRDYKTMSLNPNQFHVVVDGRISDPYRDVLVSAFSPGGAASSYVGLRPRKVGFSNKKWFDLVLGEQKLGPYEGAAAAQFSKDGKSASYAFLENKTWTVMENGRPTSHKYQELSLLRYAESGELVTGGRRSGKWVVDVGTDSFPQKGQPVDVAYRGRSKPPVVVVQTGKETLVVVTESGDFGPFESVRLLVSPSGDFQFVSKDKRGYWVNTGNSHRGPYVAVRGASLGSEAGQWAYSAQVGDGFKLFTHEGEQGPWPDMLDPYLSHSGLVYAYKSQNAWFVSTPSGTFGPFERVGVTPNLARTSSDAKHFAFAAEDRDGWSVIIDGQRGTRSGTEVIAVTWVDATTIRYIIAEDPGPTKYSYPHRQAWYLIEETVR
jgi:hypothetical protein